MKEGVKGEENNSDIGNWLPAYTETFPISLHERRAMNRLQNPGVHLFHMPTRIVYGKTGNKNVQLVSQHCCKMSRKAMLRVLHPCLNPDLLQKIRSLQVESCYRK